MVISNHLRARCYKQTEDLFDYFLKINEFGASPQKRESREYNEGLQCDCGKKSDSGMISSTQSAGFSLYLPRSSIPFSQNDDGSSLKTSSSSSNNVSSMVITTHPHVTKDFGHQSANSEPTEEQIKEVAREIARIGNELQKKHMQDIESMERRLIGLLREYGTKLSYDEFAVYINGIIGDDRNVDNFVLLLHLSKRVINETQSFCTSFYSYFREFVGTAFADEVALHNDVVQFVHSQRIQSSDA